MLRRLKITLNVLEEEKKILENKLLNTSGELKESKNKTKHFKELKRRIQKKLNSINEVINHLKVE